MTTNITAGQRIRVAVPVSPADGTPIGDRTETRIATVEKVDDDGTIHETEGRVLASRMGIDWEIYRGEAVDPGDAVAVRLSTGVVAGRMIRVVKSSAEIYSEQFQPAGTRLIPVAKCGKSWDWLRGRGLFQVGATLIEDFAPNAGAGRAVSASDGPDKDESPKPARKRPGPKPKVASVETTGVTEALPAVVVPSLVECQLVPTFPQRVRIWNIARELDVEAEVGDVCHVEAVVEKLAALCREMRGGVGRG